MVVKLFGLDLGEFIRCNELVCFSLFAFCFMVDWVNLFVRFAPLPVEMWRKFLAQARTMSINHNISRLRLSLKVIGLKSLEGGSNGIGTTNSKAVLVRTEIWLHHSAHLFTQSCNLQRIAKFKIHLQLGSYFVNTKNELLSGFLLWSIKESSMK